MDDIDKIFAVLLVVYSITLHELAHAWSATWLGDPTPGRAGRLTWNPLVQLHPIYSVVLPLMSFALTGRPMGFAFCPIDPSRFKRPLLYQALVGAAGPLANFAIALICLGLLWIPQIAPDNSVNQRVFFAVMLWNLFLGIFNLLPFPGLDGYMVIRPLLPRVIRLQLDKIRYMGYLPLLLIMTLSGPFTWPLYAKVWFGLRHVLPSSELWTTFFYRFMGF